MQLSIELSPAIKRVPARAAVMASRQPAAEVARPRSPSPIDYDRQRGVPPPQGSHNNRQVLKDAPSRRNRSRQSPDEVFQFVDLFRQQYIASIVLTTSSDTA